MWRWLQRIFNFFRQLFNPTTKTAQKPSSTIIPPQTPDNTQSKVEANKIPELKTVLIPVGIAEKPAISPLQGHIETQLKLETSAPPSYRKTKSLLTDQEKNFYFRVLRKEFGSQYEILLKVRLGDIIYLANEPANRKEYGNQLYCKHIDFVLCDKNTLEPVIAIELDDNSHRKFDHQERDQIKNHVCLQANLPIQRVDSQAMYREDTRSMVIQEIRQKIRKN